MWMILFEKIQLILRRKCKAICSLLLLLLLVLFLFFILLLLFFGLLLLLILLIIGVVVRLGEDGLANLHG